MSWKFVYSQADQAEVALTESFQPRPQEEPVLFDLPMTKRWLRPFGLALVLIGIVPIAGFRKSCAMCWMGRCAWDTSTR